MKQQEKETLQLKKIFNKPVKDNVLKMFNHLGRYYYAVKKINLNDDDIVLDVGCGQGYGAACLGMLVKYVHGIDIDKENIKIAQNLFYSDNLKFWNADEFFKKDFQVNKLICIEVIEHANKEVQPVLINAMMKCLKASGLFYFTFPVGDNMPSAYNPFHKSEPSVEHILNILNKTACDIKIEINTFINSYNKEQRYAILTGRKA